MKSAPHRDQLPEGQLGENPLSAKLRVPQSTMRLLNAKSLRLEEFFGEIPKYAILSHTWREDEVLYEDMKNGKPKEKKGYDKIKNCCVTASNDGYLYVWIDTCCIDKSSSAELSEAINSMFDWYQASSICYIYLDDVPTPDSGGLGTDLLSSSRWISRGWTLQELIAPNRVDFYSSSWTFCGTRESLEEPLHKLTFIDRRVLSGDISVMSVLRKKNELSSFSIAQRMSWASKRQTTRPEDMAYCLMGLFAINMALLYGEGGPKAFHRLQEEIIKISQDQSILAWSTRWEPILDLTGRKGRQGFFADHPSTFQSAHNIVRIYSDSEPYDITNKGLQIRLSLVTVKKISDESEVTKYISKQASIGVLNCRYDNDLSGQICIPLLATDGNSYTRLHGNATVIKTIDMEKTKPESIYIIRFNYTHLSLHSSRTAYIWIQAKFSSKVILKEHIKMECDGGVWHESTGIWKLPKQYRTNIQQENWLLFVSYNVPGKKDVYIFTIGADRRYGLFPKLSIGIFPGRVNEPLALEPRLYPTELELKLQHHRIRVKVANETIVMGEQVTIVNVSFHEEVTETGNSSAKRSQAKDKAPKR